MNAIRRHPWFTAWVALCVVLFVAGFFWQLRVRQSARRELASLAKKQQQRVQLIADAQSAASMETEVLTASLVAPVVPAIEAPVLRKPLDAYIAIAAAQEQWRGLAVRQAVALLPEEAFGFAAYAHEGPAEKYLGAVQAQLALTRLVLEKLFAVQPEKLLAVRREPLPGGGRARGREAADDFFAFDPRDASGWEGRAVQIEFTGRTPVLRTFLNSLASATEPLVVRGVEVESARADPKQPGSYSKFSVIVQWATVDGARAVATEIPAPWTTLSANGDLFDPPDSPRAPGKAVSVATGEGCELLAVKREMYRVQLAGYFGAPGDYTATLVSSGSPETWQVREGQRCESLGLSLKSFVLQRIGSGFEFTACAQLWDERKQALVTLVAHEVLLTETPLAVLQLGPASHRPREFRVGDAFRDGSRLCHIERIQLDPAEVVIVREEPGRAESERIILKPSPPRLSSVYPSP